MRAQVTFKQRSKDLFRNEDTFEFQNLVVSHATKSERVFRLAILSPANLLLQTEGVAQYSSLSSVSEKWGSKISLFILRSISTNIMAQT